MISTYIDHHNNTQKSFKKIFAFIIKKGKTTRRDIQKYTDYSWSSVSSVVSVLINNGYVFETDTINNGVGRNASYTENAEPTTMVSEELETLIKNKTYIVQNECVDLTVCG